MSELGFKAMSVRFFIYDEDNELIEVNETDFRCADGHIEYERHTVFANGVSQICLTKNSQY